MHQGRHRAEREPPFETQHDVDQNGAERDKLARRLQDRSERKRHVAAARRLGASPWKVGVEALRAWVPGL